MKPENVTPRNFDVFHILYDNDEFSIAFGQWEDGQIRIAMRWNGKGSDPGYPKTFAHPVWFMVHEDLALPILKSLIGLDKSKDENIFKSLIENFSTPKV